MRVVVTGATGNLGTSLLDALGDDPVVTSVLGVARRLPALRRPKVTWAAADLAVADLGPLVRGADVVVHLAWLVQPSHRPAVLEAANVVGTRRLLDAVALARVPSLVYASSVGACSPGPKDRRVDESWPTGGVASSAYSRQKAAVERMLDRFDSDRPGVRVVRFRPGLILKRDAASAIRRLFLGPLVPARLLRPSVIPVVPATRGLVFQTVATADVAEAMRLALHSGAAGAFNLAAEPVLDGAEMGSQLGARPVPVPPALLRRVVDLSWRAHLQPADPGWIDMALQVPLLDYDRARRELGWSPRRTSGDALLDLLGGLAANASYPTPPLAPYRPSRPRAAGGARCRPSPPGPTTGRRPRRCPEAGPRW